MKDMKILKRLSLVVLFVSLAIAASAQIKVPGTRVSFQFPNGGWKYLQTINPSKNVTVYLYSYDARAVVDESGDTLPPFMRVYVHRNYSDSPYDMAYERYTQQPFQSLDEYMDGLPAEGIGYIGAYTSATDGKDYQFRMIYFKDHNSGIEIRLETTRDTYEQMEQEFEQVMKTVKIN